MTVRALASSQHGLALRIQALRARAESDMFRALIEGAGNSQEMVDELGAMLGLPVQRMQTLLAWQPQFDKLPFVECSRRRCAFLSDPAADSRAAYLIVTDPFDTDTVAWARTRFGAMDVSLVSGELFDYLVNNHELPPQLAIDLAIGSRERAQRDKVTAIVAQGDASKLPLGDGAVDCVFSNRLLHHILVQKERAVILREFHRVSRRWVVVSFFDYRGLGGLRRLFKRLKGRKPSYDQQPTREEFKLEVAASGFTVKEIVATGAPWVSQKYFVLEKA